MKKILLLLSLFSFSLKGQISISNNFVAGTAIKISNDTISGNYAAGTNISITNGTISASGGSGTVTSFSFTNANGFVGTVTNPTTAPTLSLSNTTLVPYTGASSAVDLNTQNLADMSYLSVGAATNTTAIVYINTSVPSYTTNTLPVGNISVGTNRTTDSTKTANDYGFVDATTIHLHSGSIHVSAALYNLQRYYGTTNYSAIYGVRNTPFLSTTGSISNVYSFYDSPSITSGTVTSRYSLYVADNATSGHIGTQYGCYINNLQNATTNWAVYTNGTTPSYFGGAIKFGLNSTGTGSALLGTNCPAITTTAPYTWIQCTANDGSTIYVPAFK